jgi:hypothetical protein
LHGLSRLAIDLDGPFEFRRAPGRVDAIGLEKHAREVGEAGSGVSFDGCDDDLAARERRHHGFEFDHQRLEALHEERAAELQLRRAAATRADDVNAKVERREKGRRDCRVRSTDGEAGARGLVVESVLESYVHNTARSRRCDLLLDSRRKGIPVEVQG